MTNRVSKRLVTFRNPFFLESLEEEWPAGDYTIETEEEPLDGMSFQAYRRIRTTMIIYPKRSRISHGRARLITVDAAELDAALARDRGPIERAENEGMPGT